MLRRVEIENFMSLRHAEVDLEPLTLLYGPNGSGKSAFFKALVFVSRLLSGASLRGERGDFTLESGVTLDDLVWRGNSGLPIRFRLWLDENPSDSASYELELMKRSEGWSVSREVLRGAGQTLEVDQDHPLELETERGPRPLRPPLRATLRVLVHSFRNDSLARPMIEPILALSESIGLTWRYRPSANDIADFVKPPTEVQRRTFVRENGAGVAMELQSLQGSDRATFTAIERELGTLFPHIRSIGFKSDWQGVRLMYNSDRSEDPIPAPQESDGVLLATFLLWRLYTTSGSPMRVCLEEPENGLYPDLVTGRYDLLARFAYATDRPPLQILVATQSLELLRTVKAHPKDLHSKIRAVRYDSEAGSQFEKFSDYIGAARWAKAALNPEQIRE
jgi:predicted ATPase